MGVITTEYDPTKCQCCGFNTSQGIECICSLYPEWHLDDNGEASCGFPEHQLRLLAAKNARTIALGAPKPLTHDRFRNFR